VTRQSRSRFRTFAISVLGITLLLFGIIAVRIERSPFIISLQDYESNYPCIGATMEGTRVGQVRSELATTIAYSMGTENWIGLTFIQLKNIAYLAVRFSDTKINRIYAAGHRYNVGGGGPDNVRLSFDQVAERVYGRSFCDTNLAQRSAVIWESGHWHQTPSSDPEIVREVERVRASGIETGFNIRE
jgi:hypothetical protein